MLISYVNAAVCFAGAHIMMILNSILRNFCQSIALPAEGFLKILCPEDNLAAGHDSFEAGAFFKPIKINVCAEKENLLT